MAKLIYNTEDNGNREANIVTLDVPNDMDIGEFKIICVRLAHTLGYSHNSIDRAFGNLDHDTDRDEFIRSLFANPKEDTSKPNNNMPTGSMSY